MRIVLLTSHAIAEYDDLRMFSDMEGIEVYSIGGAYSEVPFEGKRPPLDAVRYPDLEAATQRQRERMTLDHGEPGPLIDWAKAKLAPEVIDWAEAIIVHHFPEQWIGLQWKAIKGKRVIWRTCGQSNPGLEAVMSQYRRDGLQVVRYSPRERPAFERFGSFAGEDAMIRFGKYPEDYGPWDGADAVVGNVTQDMAGRAAHCGLRFWLAATSGLPTRPAGEGSDRLPGGGVGLLSDEAMREYLRAIRVYLYTGTQPASYTLGLIEALLSGVPVVSIGAANMWAPELFEGDRIAPLSSSDPLIARALLSSALASVEYAAEYGEKGRQRALGMFDVRKVSEEWRRFLG